MMARLNIFQFLNKYVNLVLYKLVAIVCIFPLEEKHPNSNPGGEGIGNASTIDIWKDPWIPRRLETTQERLPISLILLLALGMSS